MVFLMHRKGKLVFAQSTAARSKTSQPHYYLYRGIVVFSGKIFLGSAVGPLSMRV